RRERPAATMMAHIREPPPSVSAGRPWIPASVDAVLNRQLAKDPAERYPNNAEFATDLRGALIGRAPSARRRRPRPPRLLALGAGTRAAVALAVVPLLVLHQGRGQARAGPKLPPYEQEQRVYVSGQPAAVADMVAGDLNDDGADDVVMTRIGP